MPSASALAGARGLPAIHSPRLAKLAKRRKLRAMIEKTVERLIDALDAIDGDPDAEPTLGAPEINADCRGGRFIPREGWHSYRADQEEWAKGARDDREESNEDGTDLDEGEHDPSELEPSLGAPDGHVDQTRWTQGGHSDHEENAYA